MLLERIGQAMATVIQQQTAGLQVVIAKALLRFKNSLQALTLPQFSKFGAVFLVVHSFLASGAIQLAAQTADDIGNSTSTVENNPHHWLGWVPNNLLNSVAPKPICCGRYLRHGFEPVVDDNLVFQSFSFEENQSYAWFGGDFSLRSSKSMLIGRDLLHDKNASKLSFQDSGSLYQGDIATTLQSGDFFIDDKVLTGEQANIVYLRRDLRGFGKSMTYSLDEQYIELDQAQITYCAPDDSSWSIRASSVYLDLNQQRGYAYNMRFNIGPVPLIYLPFYTFPLHSRRESGLLDPQIWQSNRHGWVYNQPYYLNLAPNYDATLYATSMTNHGVMPSAEGRLLSAAGTSFVGYSYLGNDSNASSDLNSSERSYLTLRQQGNLASGRFDYSARWDEVSDTRQLEDIPNLFGQDASNTVPRQASFNYAGDSWRLQSWWQDYQIASDDISPSSYPYTYLPRIAFASSLGAGFSYRLNYIKFNRNINDLLSETQIDNGVAMSGERNNQNISYRHQQRRSWGFANLGLHSYKQSYRLADQGELPAVSDNYYRQLELDSGLIFERNFASGASQTLEPRLYYTHTPFVDQNELPDIDSSLGSASLSSIFRPNSFSGGDRFEDSNRFALGLNSEVRGAGGNRLWLGELGRAYYLQQRRVTLAANDVDQQQSFANTRAQSPVFVRSTYTPDAHWRIILTGSWHQNYSTWIDQGLSISYQDSAFGRASMSYNRKLNTDTGSVEEQSDTSLIKNLGAQTKIFARWRYNLQERQEQQLLRGIEYQSCCWRVRLGAYTNLVDDSDDQAQYDRGWALQFHFTGITAINYDRDREQNERLQSGIESMFNGIPGLAQ